MENKKEILGQYFTKIEIVEKLLDLLFTYKKYSKNILGWWNISCVQSWCRKKSYF